MANGDITKLGTLYVNNTKYPFPTKPWVTDAIPAGAPSVGNILNYDSVNGNIEIRNTDSDDANKLRWVEVNDGDKKLLISDRCLLARVTWDELNAQGLISGKEITIDGQRYKIRLLSGGTYFRSDRYSGGTPTTNEWDRIIVNESSFSGLLIPTSEDLDTSQNTTDFNGAHNQLWNWCGMYSWCQEAYSENPSNRVVRGYISARFFGSSSSTNRVNHIGWRPVLEVLNSAPTISIEDEDLGQHISPVVKQYTVSGLDGNSLSITEKLNGVVVRTLSDVASESVLTLDLTSQWEELEFGKHTVEITVDDGNGGTAIANVSFTKIKNPIEKLPTDANLIERAKFVEKMNEEILYQTDKLRKILNSKNVVVNETDKLSSLINKVDLLSPLPVLIYGFDIDEANPDPSNAVTYTDDAIGFTPLFAGSGTTDYGSWGDTFILKGNKPCLFKDGVRQYYLNPDDYTKKEDGTASDITTGNDGDVMAEFSKAYYKIWKEGDILKFRVSNYKVDDTYCCNAFLSEDGNAAEKNFMYVGCYNATTVSDKMRSLSGKVPWVSHTIATARTQATANGSGYQQMTLSKLTYLQCLTVLVSKSRDSQTKLGQGRTSSNNTSEINTGTMNNKGQFWGDQGAVNGVKVFHVENFWGNIWQFIDGLIVSSRVTKYKVNGGYNDTGSNYTNGATVPSSGYINKIDGSNNGGLTPTVASESSSTHYCDYVHTNTGAYIALFGGYWFHASGAGSFCLYLESAASHSGVGIGSRLSY